MPAGFEYLQVIWFDSHDVTNSEPMMQQSRHNASGLPTAISTTVRFFEWVSQVYTDPSYNVSNFVLEFAHNNSPKNIHNKNEF